MKTKTKKILRNEKKLNSNILLVLKMYLHVFFVVFGFYQYIHLLRNAPVAHNQILVGILKSRLKCSKSKSQISESNRRIGLTSKMKRKKTLVHRKNCHRWTQPSLKKWQNLSKVKIFGTKVFFLDNFFSVYWITINLQNLKRKKLLCRYWKEHTSIVSKYFL